MVNKKLNTLNNLSKYIIVKSRKKMKYQFCLNLIKLLF